MDTSQLSVRLVADLAPPARPVVAGYLRELAAGLPASRRRREAILTEIADGLIEQIGTTSVLDPAVAATTAVERFGSPADLAAQFARELTGGTAHRTGFGLVSSGPPIGVLWLLALSSGQSGIVDITLRQRFGGLIATLPLVPVLLVIVVPTALIAVAGAGRAARLLPVSTGTAGRAGLVAGIGCVIADGTLIGHAVLAAPTWSPLLITAVLLSTARFTLAGAAARRCAHLLAAG